MLYPFALLRQRRLTIFSATTDAGRFPMHTQKLPNLERQRRRQVIVLTIGIGLFTAALAGAAIYYLYQTSYLRM